MFQSLNSRESVAEGGSVGIYDVYRILECGRKLEAMTTSRMKSPLVGLELRWRRLNGNARYTPRSAVVYLLNSYACMMVAYLVIMLGTSQSGSLRARR
jgi:hypothetical protein